MELSEFMQSFERQGLRSLDFERKDASLEFLRRCIVREVDMINAPLIFGASSSSSGGGGDGGGAAANGEGKAVKRGVSRGGSDGVAQSKAAATAAAAEADTPKAGRGGDRVAPPKREGSGKEQRGSMVQRIIKRVGSGIEDEDEDRDRDRGAVSAAGEAEAKPTAKHRSFFKGRK
jgi:hypothetical protein